MDVGLFYEVSLGRGIYRFHLGLTVWPGHEADRSAELEDVQSYRVIPERPLCESAKRLSGFFLRGALHDTHGLT